MNTPPLPLPVKHPACGQPARTEGMRREDWGRQIPRIEAMLAEERDAGLKLVWKRVLQAVKKKAGQPLEGSGC